MLPSFRGPTTRGFVVSYLSHRPFLFWRRHGWQFALLNEQLSIVNFITSRTPRSLPTVSFLFDLDGGCFHRTCSDVTGVGIFLPRICFYVIFLYGNRWVYGTVELPKTQSHSPKGSEGEGSHVSRKRERLHHSCLNSQMHRTKSIYWHARAVTYIKRGE